MQFLREVKLERLGLAIASVVLVADTLPHPCLAPGLVATSVHQVTHPVMPAANPNTLVVRSEHP